MAIEIETPEGTNEPFFAPHLRILPTTGMATRRFSPPWTAEEPRSAWRVAEVPRPRDFVLAVPPSCAPAAKLVTRDPLRLGDARASGSAKAA